VYGNLKPGELGYDRISEHVSGNPEEAEVRGHIWVRDGVPLANLKSDDDEQSDEREMISGYVLTLSPEGYEEVCEFEPAKYYRWSTAKCVEPAGRVVNVLRAARGVRPDRGGGDVLDKPWTSALDPLFTYGLAEVATTLRNEGHERFESGPVLDYPQGWPRFYRLQAAYMLTCSILERIAFWVAPNEGPTAAVKTVGVQPEFVAAVEQVDVKIPQRDVYRADRPTERAKLEAPGDFANWAYQVRSNLMHRGKSAWSEAELVRTTLIDLHDVLRVYLSAKVPEFLNAWAESEPEGEPDRWQIKADCNNSSGD
jgi:hypothetical protein